MIYGVTKVKIATDFADFFPKNHQNTLLYRKYRSYGGAQTLVVMLRAKHGDIYNYPTLKKIQDISGEIDRLPGVNHQEVFSLSSYREAYAGSGTGRSRHQALHVPGRPPRTRPESRTSGRRLPRTMKRFASSSPRTAKRP